MDNKYRNAISKIKATDEFKTQLIEKMKLEQEKQNSNIGLKLKIRKLLSTIAGILGFALCSGLVYATITGSIKFGGQEIEFSENLEQYTEVVENQYIEQDGNKIELTSKAVDDGFVILQFDVTLSDEQARIAEESCGLEYLSFNDADMNDGYPSLAGANYNVIIDGEKYWLRGASEYDIIENIPNRNYTFYQLWFLSDNEIGDKEEFTITLDDVKMVSSEIVTEFDEKFEIELSKTKVLENTTKYQPENAKIQYKRLTNSINTIIETPLQTLVKMETVFEDVNNKNISYVENKDYIGDLRYKVYDQNNEELSEFDVITDYKFYYPNGKVEVGEGDDFRLYDGFETYDYRSYVAIAQNENVSEITLEVLEYNDYTGTTKEIGEYKINLKNGKVKCENKDEIIDVAEDARANYEYPTIDVSDIKEFSIDLKTDNYEITNLIDYKYPEVESGIIKPIVPIDSISSDYQYSEEETKTIDESQSEEGEIETVQYSIDLEDTGTFFQLIVFYDKELYPNFDRYVTGDIDPIKIAENDNYIVVLNVPTDYDYNLIKDIVKTIELK